MQIADPFGYFMEGTNGKGVLLVHGLTGAPVEMRLVARQLHRRGYTVWLVMAVMSAGCAARAGRIGWRALSRRRSN
jgi:carboxylesterase